MKGGFCVWVKCDVFVGLFLYFVYKNWVMFWIDNVCMGKFFVKEEGNKFCIVCRLMRNFWYGCELFIVVLGYND